MATENAEHLKYVYGLYLLMDANSLSPFGLMSNGHKFIILYKKTLNLRGFSTKRNHRLSPRSHLTLPPPTRWNHFSVNSNFGIYELQPVTNFQNLKLQPSALSVLNMHRTRPIRFAKNLFKSGLYFKFFAMKFVHLLQKKLKKKKTAQVLHQNHANNLRRLVFLITIIHNPTTNWSILLSLAFNLHPMKSPMSLITPKRRL